MYTPHLEPSPHRCCQDPLDRTRRSLHRHRCRSPVIVCHRRHRHHHGVGYFFAPSAATAILILFVQRRCNPTNKGITAASPPFSSPPAILPLPVAFPPSPPSRSPMAPSWTAASVDALWYNSASADPVRALLVERRANYASAAVTAAAMPRSSLRRPELDPPSLLGPPPPVGRRRHQHVDVDARPWRLRHHKVWCV